MRWIGASPRARRIWQAKTRRIPRQDRRLRTTTSGSPSMKLFLDTADIEEIRTVNSWGVLDGVTTNPTLFGKVKGMTYEEVLRELPASTAGPGPAEWWAPASQAMFGWAGPSRHAAATSWSKGPRPLPRRPRP